MRKDVLKWIRQGERKGYPEHALRAKLVEVGHDPFVIEGHFDHIRSRRKMKIFGFSAMAFILIAFIVGISLYNPGSASLKGAAVTEPGVVPNTPSESSAIMESCKLQEGSSYSLCCKNEKGYYYCKPEGLKIGDYTEVIADVGALAKEKGVEVPFVPCVVEFLSSAKEMKESVVCYNSYIGTYSITPKHFGFITNKAFFTMYALSSDLKIDFTNQDLVKQNLNKGNILLELTVP